MARTRRVWTMWVLALGLGLAAGLAPGAGSAARAAEAGARAEAAADDAPRVLIILAKQFNRAEFQVPILALTAAGYTVDVAGPERGRIPVSDKGPSEHDAHANLSLFEVDVDRYLGLVIPGGFSPGNLEKLPKSIAICREFMEAGKPVAGICHGPRLLMRGELLEGRVATCLYGVANELANAWRDGEYGKYLDREVVVDRNLITSRYPGDLPPFVRAVLAALAEAGGRPVPDRPGRAVVVAPGLGGHEKWVLTSIPDIFNIEVAFLAGGGDVVKHVASPDYDAGAVDVLLVVEGEGLEALKGENLFKKLVGDVAGAGKPILGVGAAADLVRAVGAKDVRAIEGDYAAALAPVVAAVNAAPGKAPEASPEPCDVAVYLQPGFDDAVFAAVGTELARRNLAAHLIGEADAWVRGGDGYPARTRKARRDLSHVRPVFSTKGIQVLSGRQNPMDPAAAGALGKDLKAVAAAARADVNAGGPYTAAFLLRQGFDGYVYAAMKAYLVGKGHKVVVLGPAKGELRGMNGVRATVGAAWDDEVDLAKDAVLVAPGGLWPEKAQARQATQPAWIEEQALSDAKRIVWAVNRYQDGATLMTFGLDSLRLGRQPPFKGLKFASSPQTVWGFGRQGGKFSGETARVTAERLVSCRGAGWIAEAIALLEAGAKPEAE